MEKSFVGEALKGATETLWVIVKPLILTHYDEKHAALTVAFSILCCCATLAWAHWAKLFIFAGPKVNRGISKVGIVVSLPILVILGVYLLWEALGFLWGFVPAPFGSVWLKGAALWLIKIVVPAVIFFGVVWQILRHPILTAKKGISAFGSIKAYFRACWGNTELAPGFTTLGALGLNYVVHHEEWSNGKSVVPYWPSLVMCLLGIAASVQFWRESRKPKPAEEKAPPKKVAPPKQKKGEATAIELEACPTCGSRVKAKKAFCTKCGTPMRPRVRVAPQPPPQAPRAEEVPTAAPAQGRRRHGPI